MKCTVCGLTAEMFEGQVCPNCGSPVAPAGGEESDRSAAGLFRKRKQPPAHPAAPDSSTPFSPPPFPQKPEEPAAEKKRPPYLLAAAILAAVALAVAAGMVLGAKKDADRQNSAPASVQAAESFSSGKGLITSRPSALPTEAPAAPPEVSPPEVSAPDSTSPDDAALITLPGGSTAPEADFFFPHSGTEALRYEMLDAAFGSLDSALQLQCSQLAINEIYARYGYNFHPEKSDTARQAYEYFNSLDWYTQISAGTGWSNTGEVPVNAIEASNIELLAHWQKDHGLR